MEMSQQLINLEEEKETISAVKNEQIAAIQMMEKQFSERNAEFIQMENDLKAVIEQKDHEIVEIERKYNEMMEVCIFKINFCSLFPFFASFFYEVKEFFFISLNFNFNHQNNFWISFF